MGGERSMETFFCKHNHYSSDNTFAFRVYYMLQSKRHSFGKSEPNICFLEL